MILKQNENRSQAVVNETVNGVNIIATLVSSVVNTTIPDNQYRTGTGFDPSNVTIQVDLMRNGMRKAIIPATNLALLAAYHCITKEFEYWHKGRQTVAPATGVYAQVQRVIFIPFGGHINVKGDDQLIITCQVNKSTYGAGVDASQSVIQVEQNQSIGIETALHTLNFQAIQASQFKDQFNLGDNVLDIALISFQADATKEIWQTASLSSDRLDWTKNDGELFLQDLSNFDAVFNPTYSSTGRPYYPHNRLIHANKEIDKAKLIVSLNSGNVNASENFVVWTSFDQTVEQIQKAVNMSNKHAERDVQKITA